MMVWTYWTKEGDKWMFVIEYDKLRVDAALNSGARIACLALWSDLSKGQITALRAGASPMRLKSLPIEFWPLDTAIDDATIC